MNLQVVKVWQNDAGLTFKYSKVPARRHVISCLYRSQIVSLPLENLIPLQLLDPNLFQNHTAEFPHDKIARVSLYYPMVQTEKLRTELN